MTDRFPIRFLSEATGVGASTLRAWERRYGLLTPARTPKGHRLYQRDDIKRIERIVKLLGEGHSLPSIARLLDEPSASLPASTDGSVELVGVWRKYLSDTLQAVEDFSSERLEAIHNEVSALYPLGMMTEQLIQPVLHEIGKRWQSRPTGIAEEHFYTHWIRNRLAARFHHALEQASGKRILCASVPGDCHEIGLMLFSLSLMARGYRVVYLGVDLPVEQLSAAIERSGSRAVVLSARQLDDRELLDRLARFVSHAPVPVFIGGLASDDEIPRLEQYGAVRLGSGIEVATRIFTSRVVSRDPVDRRLHGEGMPT